jgi:alanyl-tRNA synthetase
VNAYPELRTRRDFILETVDAEEQQFLRTLSGGLVKLGAVIEQVKQQGVQSSLVLKPLNSRTQTASRFI